MPINVNPVDFRGFSVGTNIPQLPNVGALGLQAVQLKMNEQASLRDQAMQQAAIRSRDEAMLRQNMMERARLEQQNNQFNAGLNLDTRKQGLLEQQALFNQNMAQQQLDSENALKNQQLALTGRGQDIDAARVQQDMAYKQMAMGIKQLSEKKKEDLNSMGAFAASAKLALDQAPDPTAANLLRSQIVDEGIKNGYIPETYGKQLKQMPLSEFKRANDMLLFQTDKAKDYQNMKKSAESKNNMSLSISPDGTVEYTSKPTPASTTEIQKSLGEADEGLKQLNKYVNPPEDMFGLASTKYSVGTRTQEMFKAIPGVGANEQDKKKLAEFTDYNANAKLMIMKTAKAMAGSRFSDTDLAMIEQIMPQVGFGHTKVEYDTKMQAVTSFLNDMKAAKSNLLAQGYKLNTPEYEAAMSEQVQNSVGRLSSTGQKPVSEMTDEELMAALQGAK